MRPLVYLQQTLIGRPLLYIFLYLIMPPVSASAGSNGHFWHLQNSGHCVKCDLSKMRLTEMQRPGAQLRKTNFNKSFLDYANLAKADLRDAILSGASLRSVSLKGADLRGAWLINANLNNADLRDANLQDAVIGFSNINGARLDGAIWIDGNICDTGSVGRCANPQPPKPVRMEAETSPDEPPTEPEDSSG